MCNRESIAEDSAAAAGVQHIRRRRLDQVMMKNLMGAGCTECMCAERCSMMQRLRLSNLNLTFKFVKEFFVLELRR